METIEKTDVQRKADDLRALADYLDGLSLPPGANVSVPDVYIFCYNQKAFGNVIRQLHACVKDANDVYLNADKFFGDIKLQATIARELACERIKTGERVIAAKPERTLPAEPEKVQEIYEWKCPDSFLALAEQSEA